jgi:DNA-binding transcriptional LysR family regulator
MRTTMDLEALRAFAAVAECGSFVAAAQRVGLPRATLRRRIDELEVAVGVALLDRSPRGAFPTEAGLLLAHQGLRLIQDADALLVAAREAAAVPARELRAVLPVGMPPHVLSMIFTFMGARMPDVTALISQAEDPIARLQGDMDLAVTWSVDVPPGPWTTYDLVELREWLVGSQAYLEAHGTPASVADLAGHELFAWSPPDGGADRWPLVAGGEVVVRPRLVSSDVHALRVAAAHGLGLAFVPDALIPDPSPDLDTLVPVLTETVGRRRTLRLVVPTARAALPRVRALVELAQSFAVTVV